MFKSSVSNSFIFCLIITIYCLLSSCATTEQLDIISQDIIRLKNENTYMKNDIKKLQEKTATVATEDSFNVIRKSQAEIQSRLSNLEKDIQILNGRFDENKYNLEKSIRDLSSEIEIIKAQITNLEVQIKDINSKISTVKLQQKEPLKRQHLEAEATPETLETEQPPEEASADILLDKVSQYKAAYNTFKDKRYKEARKKFEEFLKRYPQDDLSDNAQFWIAETYYREKDYENAILSYEIVLKKYPDSQKVPNALLKQGLSFIEMGDKKTGKIILEQLKERYPNTREAGLAKKYLEKLKNNF